MTQIVHINFSHSIPLRSTFTLLNHRTSLEAKTQNKHYKKKPYYWWPFPDGFSFVGNDHFPMDLLTDHTLDFTDNWYLSVKATMKLFTYFTNGITDEFWFWMCWQKYLSIKYAMKVLTNELTDRSWSSVMLWIKSEFQLRFPPLISLSLCFLFATFPFVSTTNVQHFLSPLPYHTTALPHLSESLHNKAIHCPIVLVHRRAIITKQKTRVCSSSWKRGFVSPLSYCPSSSPQPPPLSPASNMCILDECCF